MPNKQIGVYDADADDWEKVALKMPANADERTLVIGAALVNRKQLGCQTPLN